MPYDCTVNYLPQQPCFEPRMLVCMKPGLFSMFCAELHNLVLCPIPTLPQQPCFEPRMLVCM